MNMEQSTCLIFHNFKSLKLLNIYFFKFQEAQSTTLLSILQSSTVKNEKYIYRKLWNRRLSRIEDRKIRENSDFY